MKEVQGATIYDEMIGKVITEISGAEEGSEYMFFKTADGEEFAFYHEQDCCESVDIEDVCGNIQDLIGSPILRAEEVHSAEEPPTPEGSDYSYTWTFYKFATINGWVDIRWFGTSNGYYSESVYFRHTPAKG